MTAGPTAMVCTTTRIRSPKHPVRWIIIRPTALEVTLTSAHRTN